jgi:hypothetical protein
MGEQGSPRPRRAARPGKHREQETPTDPNAARCGSIARQGGHADNANTPDALIPNRMSRPTRALADLFVVASGTDSLRSRGRKSVGVPVGGMGLPPTHGGGYRGGSACRLSLG